MTPEKSIVLDANILIRAVLGQKVRQLLVTHVDRVLFYTPLPCLIEAQNYLPALLEKRGIYPAHTTTILHFLLPLLHTVEECLFMPFRADALQRISARDINDWPVVATALYLNCPVWTEDQDFFGSGIATWTTDRVHLFLADA